MSDPKSRAAELKAAGNAAFSSGDFNQSISLFTEAISLCPDDHVFYSNRSGAYASINQYEKALEDAEKCVELNPAFIKGYSRKGLALFQLGRVDDAKNAYQAGLEKDPQNAQLKEGLAQIEESQKAPPAASNPFGQMFGPSMWSKLMQDPVTKQHLNDPAFVKKMQDIQKNPDTFGSYASDPKVSQALGVLFNLGANAFSGRAGADGATAEDFDAMADEEEAEEIHAKPSAKPAQQSTSQPKKPEPVAKSPEATEAEKLKNDGNTAFKARKFDEAIALYEKAAALDATSIVYLNNIAACHYEKKDWDACVAAANRAIEVGREHMASYKDIAKAWMRIGNARYAEKKWKEAVDAYEKSNIEDYTDKAKEQIKKCNAHLKKEAELAYLDEGKSEEEKNKGNALFSDGKYIDAITHYTEALKRNPNNYKVYSNRAACYTKLMDWQRGLDDCEACLKADPKFVKAYIRKAKIQHFLKQYHKALETYEAGLAIDPQSSELLDGRRLTLQAINAGESDPEAQKARAAEAMKDPEIQQILRDPTINKVLTDMQDNPAAGQAALRDKDIKAKIEKLIAAGVLQVK